MDRFEDYNQIADRLADHARDGTTDSAPDILRIPASYYLDPELWKIEVERIFKRVPLLLAFTGELRQPGRYKAMKAAGVPVVMIRGRDGVVRAFLNACRHRGARVMEEGTGKCVRMVCPYHAWAYDERGALVKVADPEKFGDFDTAGEGLTELPCAEVAGLIFVSLTPGAAMDIDAWLGGFREELEKLEMADWEVCATQSLETANWKLAHDGYVDGYHIASLHPKTIAAFSQSNVLTYDAFGPHQRIGFAHHNILPVTEKPPAERTLNDGLTVIRTIFPHVSLAVRHGEGGVVSQLFPGPTHDTSYTIQAFLAPKVPETEEEKAMFGMRTKMLYEVVRDEDYKTVDGVQEGLASGAIPDVIFGRNEIGNQRLHKWIAYYCQETPDPSARPDL
ncbi:aromatic ring-hydroxylating dioxygenase subunit alpha [Iodidimonas sp. SYSU 1G8]|uniref:aromatic ring-hydroxylating oxygenase subunit alpha n=1 Tax=Iodidimonas sp. SYSU 1G8 TaxID=3133967 RepID=UPI0031FEDE39